MSIGERIAILRKEQNISQGQLADALSVSRQAVSKWENDLNSPDTIKLIQLADVLNTEVEYLATGKKPVYVSPPPVINLVKHEDRVVEKIVDKPVIRYITKVKYRRNPIEYAIISIISLVFGILLGLLLK